MIAITALVATCAAGSLVLSGYLFGAKKGQDARAQLAAEGATKDSRCRQLEADSAEKDATNRELAARLAPLEGARSNGQDKSVEALREEMRSLAGAVMQREKSQEELKAQIQGYVQSMAKASPDSDSLRRDLQKMMTPLLQRENETKGLRDMMRELVGPMLDRQRLSEKLSKLDAGAGSLGELPRLLDSIAEKGSFDAVVLSDDVGLPLGASANAQEVEKLAGLSAMLLTLTDRVKSGGAPAPIAVVVHDEANQSIVYRIFSVGSARYMLMAVARGTFVAPEALDPALPKLEKVLTKQELEIAVS